MLEKCVCPAGWGSLLGGQPQTSDLKALQTSCVVLGRVALAGVAVGPIEQQVAAVAGDSPLDANGAWGGADL